MLQIATQIYSAQ